MSIDRRPVRESSEPADVSSTAKASPTGTRLRTWGRSGFGGESGDGPPLMRRLTWATHPREIDVEIDPRVPIRPAAVPASTPVLEDSGVRMQIASMRDMLSTTPGRLLLITTVLVIAAIIAGAYASDAMNRRSTTLSTIITDTEPISQSAQVLYSSLSIADASANAAFISGGLESPQLRTRYNDAIATASESLIQAASGTADENRQVSADLDTISTQLPIYTGLIEAARTNNRQGNPVGSSYLGEASNLMQSTILPSAERLSEKRSAAVDAARTVFSQPPWGVYVVLALLAASLIATHLYLSRRTRRRFNVGILVAVTCVLISFVWLLASGLLSVSATHTANRQGLEPLRGLTQARILTQKARSDETLALARRGDQDVLGNDFRTSTATIGQILGTYQSQANRTNYDATLKAASVALSRWQLAHNRAMSYSDTGDFSGAVLMTVGNAPDSAAAAYTDLDKYLVTAITDSRNTFRNKLETARVLIGFTSSGIVVLMVIASAATLIGMFPRIREYR